jgi:serine/threonine protein kinase
MQYMAPEQLEGKEADARTDIFALGTLIYEMATGRKAFKGKSHASLIAAILDREPPPISTLQSMAPPALDHTVRICMSKDPEARWQTAHDILLQLKWLADAGSHGIPKSVAAPLGRRELLLLLFASVVAIAFLVLALVHFQQNPMKLMPSGSRFQCPPIRSCYLATTRWFRQMAAEWSLVGQRRKERVFFGFIPWILSPPNRSREPMAPFYLFGRPTVDQSPSLLV